MRLLYLTPGCFDKGGISRYNRYQITALRDLYGSDNIDVVSLLGPGDDSFEGGFDVAFFAGGLSLSQKAAFIAHACLSGISRRPDIVLAAHVNLSGAAAALARPLRAKTILNVYGSEVWSGFRRDAAWGLASVHHVVADCHFTAQYLEARGLRPPGSIEVVWDCVDRSRFSPGVASPDVRDRYGIPDPSAGINVMTLGRLSTDARHKGYERLLDAFSRVASTFPTMRLIYAGRGNLVEPLRAAARARGLADRVFFTGMVHERDLPDVYRSAHVFSLVSDRGVGRGEGIPLTPLEAAACGVPIIVGNQDGSREAVVEGVNGFVIDPFDIDDHARKLALLAGASDLRAAMGAAATRRIEAEFAYEHFRARHRQLVASWLGGVEA